MSEEMRSTVTPTVAAAYLIDSLTGSKASFLSNLATRVQPRSGKQADAPSTSTPL